MTVAALDRKSLDLALSRRVLEIRDLLLATPPRLCPERALLITEYFKNRANRKKPVVLQKAEALSHLLRRKKVAIYPRELLVGCFTSYRVGGGLYPELHGIPMMEDLFQFPKRKVNPIQVSRHDRRRLLWEVLPFFGLRFLGIRAFPFARTLAFLRDQFSPTSHLINETGGISHFVPNYAELLEQGTDGYRKLAAEAIETATPGSRQAHFLEAVLTVCDGLAAFAEGYEREASRLAETEQDQDRKRELEGIAEICGRVPRFPARTFHEALQAILFAQVALNLESLDNAVSPGRLDQILWPYYERDLAAGRIDPAAAFELLGLFALKLCEIVPIFSRRLTRFHGGMFNGQVVVVGGVDRDGGDATNDLTHLFVALMGKLRTRQPNYHARLHRGSRPSLVSEIGQVLAEGAASPACYNDDVIVPMLEQRGMSKEDARDYATVGCVEPVAAGRSFLSTDAALFNLPLCLELALNQGRRFGKSRRVGAATRTAEECLSTEELFLLFTKQLEEMTGRLLRDLQGIEKANARIHPTPLTSMLLDGCLASQTDATAGGATYNGSGIQGVGAVEVGDSLTAIETVVFREQRASMADVVAACRNGFRNAEALQARLANAPTYGNDDPLADRYVARVMEAFAQALEGRQNSRGGEYVAGFYSVTAHQAFGEVVGALPSGRLAGVPFSSGISPGSGRDRLGPTAALRSQSRLPTHLARNGVNFNMKLAPFVAENPAWLSALLVGGFKAGAMQVQMNVLDPKILIEARDHPGRHKGLLVRVSGYSAYFDDLSPAMQQEIIDRTLCEENQSS